MASPVGGRILGLRAQLAGLSDSERANVVLALVRAEVVAVVGRDAPQAVEGGIPMAAIGYLPRAGCRAVWTSRCCDRPTDTGHRLVRLPRLGLVAIRRRGNSTFLIARQAMPGELS